LAVLAMTSTLKPSRTLNLSSANSASPCASINQPYGSVSVVELGDRSPDLCFASLNTSDDDHWRPRVSVHRRRHRASSADCEPSCGSSLPHCPYPYAPLCVLGLTCLSVSLVCRLRRVWDCGTILCRNGCANDDISILSPQLLSAFRSDFDS
jgi:hypothetical protein